MASGKEALASRFCRPAASRDAEEPSHPFLSGWPVDSFASFRFAGRVEGLGRAPRIVFS